jgi:hypothetical protein
MAALDILGELLAQSQTFSVTEMSMYRLKDTNSKMTKAVIVM